MAFSRYLILKAGKTLVVPSPALTAMPQGDSDADVFFYKVDGQALKVRLLSFLGLLPIKDCKFKGHLERSSSVLSLLIKLEQA